MDLFYSPEYAKTGDVIPYYNEETKRFEGYYLKNWNPDVPKIIMSFFMIVGRLEVFTIIIIFTKAFWNKE